MDAPTALPLSGDPDSDSTPAPLLPTATPNPSPTTPPTATQVPAAQIDRADTALFDGDWERAIAEYQAALLQAQGNDTQLETAARLGLGKARLRSGDATGAISELSILLDRFPAGDLSFEAEFLLGDALTAQGTWGPAIEHYENALALRPGALDSYLRERIARAKGFNGDFEGALADYQSAITAPRASDTLYLREKLAEVHALSGNDEAALEQYAFISENTTSDFTKARMDLLSGQALLRLGRTEEAHARYLHAVESYPQSQDSYTALVALVDAGEEVNDFARGLTDYYAGQYVPAMAAFNRYLIAVPDHDAAPHYYNALALREDAEPGAAVAEFLNLIDTHAGDDLWDNAWFELARTYWLWMDNLPGATQTLLNFVSAAPADPRAPEALDLAAGISERNSDLAQAAQVWDRIPVEYPASPQASLAAFDSGMVLYRSGDFASAAERFEQSAALTTDPARLAAARLWVGKSAAATGDTTEAQSAWALAATLDPTGYYSVRASDLLAGRPPFFPRSGYSLAVDLTAELPEAEAWLRSQFNVPNPLPLSQLDTALSQDARLARGAMLWRLGHFDSARLEFASLQKDLEGDPEQLFRLTVFFNDLGHHQAAILAARQILRLAGMDTTASLTAPAYFNHVRFGAYYPELVLPAAQANGLDPLLLYAVMRQESLFDGTATSSAAARGLMQIIPATGEEIARELNWPDYEDSDLYRPFISARFGAYYLSKQLKEFDGDPYAALAAYNGGPGNAAAWNRLAPEDPDLFVEVVRFSETQTYVRSIYEVFAIYREIYGK